ncbi:hypothetical protein F5Y05DRAFT_364055 [Hypoxylon sp. FL0543]|nr:hypothetical protein F5Y05DRAFT_364055 [Hypoxylon sp. FL0543]
MGFWGARLFQAHHDIELALEVDPIFGEGANGLGMSRLVYQTQMLAPVEAQIYEIPAYEDIIAQMAAKTRAKLDADGLGHDILQKWRGKEDEGHRSKYRVIIAGALLMRAGAKIEDSELQHLRELVPHINCNQDFTLPLLEEGFHGPGRAQFLAALDNYQPGVPRSYYKPSCFYCGKVKADVGKAPSKCGGCRLAWYCGKVSPPIFLESPQTELQGSHARLEIIRHGNMNGYWALLYPLVCCGRYSHRCL